MAASDVQSIEREVEEARARLGEKIDLIQDKLTVSGIVDEVMGAAGVPRLANGHDFVLALLRRHPVPLMIAAAGLGYAIYRMNRTGRSVGELEVEPVSVPVMNTGRARVYDPDLPVIHPRSDVVEGRQALDAQA
ncbi:MAG: DUF3618 domain-containing protein [Methylobacteriaceae bacterium]|nr:DUF3618 domain-containing protein [Methylobacteriaceae bacterium]